MQSKFWCSGLALVLLGVCAPAAATLGEDLSSVLLDQAQLQAGLEVTSTAGFAVHSMQLPSGTTVREYVSPAGMVFAVSWQGPSMPDLRQVLGRYFAAYVDAVKNQATVGGARALQQSGLVVQSGGHMRAFFGRAYVPAMLPRGVSAEEIQ
ncbi:MAG: DUF2844 domain-containing protein [Burkholderiales bacterium]|nr:DUF2844 domain-containing protein [Burkholderiales bacterium]